MLLAKFALTLIQVWTISNLFPFVQKFQCCHLCVLRKNWNVFLIVAKEAVFLVYRHSEFRRRSERIQLYSNRNEFLLRFYRNVHNHRCRHHTHWRLFQENKRTLFRNFYHVFRFHFIVTARKHSLRSLCFHRCLSVHGGGISVLGGDPVQVGVSVREGLC